MSGRPTALLIPSPWSGDEHDPVPRAYHAWFWLYRTTRIARHRLGLHDRQGYWLGLHDRRRHRCTWCGKP